MIKFSHTAYHFQLIISVTVILNFSYNFGYLSRLTFVTFFVNKVKHNRELVSRMSFCVTVESFLCNNNTYHTVSFPINAFFTF